MLMMQSKRKSYLAFFMVCTFREHHLLGQWSWIRDRVGLHYVTGHILGDVRIFEAPP